MSRRAAFRIPLLFLLIFFCFIFFCLPAQAGQGSDQTSEIYTLLEWINRERQAAGIHQLDLDEDLTAVAAAHAREMRDLGYYSHYSPITGSPGNRLRQHGIEFAKVAENISAGYDVEHAFRRLLDSAPHKATLLDDSYARIGLAAMDAGRYVYLVQVLIATHPPEQVSSDSRPDPAGPTPAGHEEPDPTLTLHGGSVEPARRP